MKSDWIDAFLVFSECMNFTHAAEQLYISQPALHTKIRKLSEHLEMKLYQKQGRNLILTDEGRKIQVFAREMRERSEAFIGELRSDKSTSPVKLAAGNGAYLYLLGSSILEFNRTANTPIQLITSNKEQTIACVESGEAHIGIAAVTSSTASLKHTLLTKVNQAVVMQKSHRLANRKRLSVSDLEGESLILPPMDKLHRINIEQTLQSKEINYNVSVEASGWELMIQFVQLGAGITIVNGCCNIPKTLISIPIPELPEISYSIIEKTNNWRNEAVDQLKQILLKNKNAWKNKQ